MKKKTNLNNKLKLIMFLYKLCLPIILLFLHYSTVTLHAFEDSAFARFNFHFQFIHGSRY